MPARARCRPVALLLLLAIGITLTANGACVLPAVNAAVVEPEVPHAHTGTAVTHGGAEDQPGVPADAPAHESNHATDGCGMLMACGLAAPAAHAPDVAFTADPFESRLALVRDAYDSPALPFEPPPPRDRLS